MRVDQAVDPPLSNEVEVSVFGPGRGECIVAHLGDGVWIVADSCIDRSTKRPVALDYLRQLDIDPSTAVRLVIATHWHDDHIGGLHDVFAAARAAQFVCPVAFTKSEFLMLAKIGGDQPQTRNPGLRELWKTLTLIAEEDRRKAYALADRVLMDESLAGRPVRIHSLSPSDAAVDRFMSAVRERIPSETTEELAIPDLKPNHVALALWVTCGEQHILLGSDLEESGSLHGWSEVVSSAVRPTTRAGAYKVAHHGSPNADPPVIWEQLLTTEPHAAITPHLRGSTSLPRPDDLARIATRTPNVYVSSTTSRTRSRSRRGAVGRTIESVTKRFWDAENAMGHVRLRAGMAGGPWRVALFGNAWKYAA